MKTELQELGAQLTASTPQDTDRLRSSARSQRGGLQVLLSDRYD